MIGATPEQLLAAAIARLAERDAEIVNLMKHLPRKYDKRIDALRKPADEARSAIRAVSILITNQRRIFEAPDYPKED